MYTGSYSGMRGTRSTPQQNPYTGGASAYGYGGQAQSGGQGANVAGQTGGSSPGAGWFVPGQYQPYRGGYGQQGYGQQGYGGQYGQSNMRNIMPGFGFAGQQHAQRTPQQAQYPPPPQQQQYMPQQDPQQILQMMGMMGVNPQAQQQMMYQSLAPQLAQMLGISLPMLGYYTGQSSDAGYQQGERRE